MSFDENLLFTQTLRDRLDAESAMQADLGTSVPAWFAIKTLDGNRSIIERNFDPNSTVGVSDPPLHQIMWAEAVSKILNHEIAHDGRWVVGFTHPPGFGVMLMIEPKFDWRRAVKIWIDRDGDPQFTIDCIDPWEAVVSRDPDHFVNQAEEAWGHWKKLMRDVIAPKDYQLKQVAKGHA